MILYFSASGNSRFIAEHAAALLEDEACSLNARIRLDQHDPLESARPYVLVCPTYAWRIPRIVEEHLRHTELKGSRQIYLLVSACGSSGNTGSYAAWFFRSIGMEWMGWHTLLKTLTSKWYNEDDMKRGNRKEGGVRRRTYPDVYK